SKKTICVRGLARCQPAKSAGVIKQISIHNPNRNKMSNKIKIQRVHSQYYVVNGKAFIQNEQGEWVTPFDVATEEEKTAFKNFLKQF
ncbi:hypothetical protein, partial [Ornithobacterium rhinotracheale]